ncbi:hypothetical protein B0H66DRAFT_632011 [Apodospora peruviana]|uniref:Uncharacterized protein n=1 Tax=Apodospora peruviana TaxID=516989 RepID=A0AAE0HUY7_9PEZI|nr:hypothetical protein B0H66DRAFT_632011 [Apodospora peruviana]
MQLHNNLIAALVAIGAVTTPVSAAPGSLSDLLRRDVLAEATGLARPDQSFIPNFAADVVRGTKAEGSADCIVSPASKARIPCTCPPDSDDPNFLAGLALALNKGSFPVGSDVVAPINLAQWNSQPADQAAQAALQQQRATVMIQVLQSLSGQKGVGCPGASTPALVKQQNPSAVGPAGK